MSKGLVIVDYGMGNLHSVVSALRYLGVDPVVTEDRTIVQAADTIILPGVGSFFRAMAKLESSGLADALREAVLVQQRKIFGICLGQQLMAEYGTEDGGAKGLGLLTGVVDRIVQPPGGGLSIPHVGFNKVRFQKDSVLFRGFDRPVDCYFVHSYRLGLAERPGLASLCDYGGDFVAAYEYQNLYCAQFHPEKSQSNGLKILSNFLSA